MDSSKFPQGSDECSSSESGWTAYIASPDNEDDQDDDQDHSKDVAEEDDEEETESDDSMASDATSGPSYQHGNFNKHYGLGHARNENERKRGGKKEQKEKDKKQHAEKIKAAKDKADSATRSKKSLLIQ